MDKNLETAILFSAHKLEQKNVIFLVPQKLIYGKSNDDTTLFTSILDNANYMNMDEAVRNDVGIGFYYIRKFKDLIKQYKSKDSGEVSRKYLDDLCKKVYYYDNYDVNNFESCFLKECSIEEFNKKYDVKFKYTEEDPNKKEPENLPLDPVSNNLKNMKSACDKNVFFQDVAKKKILTTLYNNFITEGNNHHILMSGPQGVGKTTFLKQLQDSSEYAVFYTTFESLIESDYAGMMESLLMGLYKENKSLQNGIIIIDQVDTNTDYCEALELTEEILKFIKNGTRTARIRGKLITFFADKITFILCGNFEKAKKDTFVPMEFFEHDMNFEMNNIPSHKDLIRIYGFADRFFDYFTTFTTFEDLTYEQAKRVIIELETSPFNSYLRQLKRQGITINIPDNVIDIICKHIYSKRYNLKNIDKIIKKIFEDVVMESLNYVGQPAELNLNEEIVRKNKKGFQFTLKNGSQNI